MFGSCRSAGVVGPGSRPSAAESSVDRRARRRPRTRRSEEGGGGGTSRPGYAGAARLRPPGLGRSISTMDLGMSGKVALVTAASKGLGRGAALAMSREGARVAICARSPEPLEATAAELPGEVLAIPADVTEPDVPATAGRGHGRAVRRAGHPGRRTPAVPHRPAPSTWRTTQMLAAVNANLLTSIRLVQAAVPHMRAAGGGRICLITSFSIKQPIPGLAYSNTARTGLWAWAKTAAQDLIGDDITLNLACPGLHATERAKALGAQRPDGRPRRLRQGGRVPLLRAGRVRQRRRAPGGRRRYPGPPLQSTDVRPRPGAPRHERHRTRAVARRPLLGRPAGARADARHDDRRRALTTTG